MTFICRTARRRNPEFCRHAALLWLLAFFFGWVAPASDAQERSAEATIEPSVLTQVVMLGTGTPTADPERSGPSVAVVVRGTPYIIDCGPGLVRRASAAHAAGVAGLSVNRLGTAFITHLHSDHTAGLADLLLTPWVLGRRTPLELHGPPGVASMAEHTVQAFEADIRMRIEGLEKLVPAGARINAHEIEPGVVFKDDNVSVTAFLVEHGSWPRAFGYRFDTPDRTIVISGDARPSPALIEIAKGCDILIHEVYSTTGYAMLPTGAQEYHGSFHTSSAELAEIARQTRPRLLVLYHQLMFGASREQLLAEIRLGYDGLVVFADDLDVY